TRTRLSPLASPENSTTPIGYCVAPTPDMSTRSCAWAPKGSNRHAARATSLLRSIRFIADPNSPAESAEIMSVLLLSHTCGNDHQYKRDTFRWEVLEMVSSSVCLCVPLHQIFGCL